MRLQPIENKTLVPPISSKLKINSSVASKGIERSYGYALNLRLMKYLGYGEARPSTKNALRVDSLEGSRAATDRKRVADFFDSSPRCRGGKM
jgi:hypothetical protein